MAERRMLSKSISVSEKVNCLPELFDMLLYTWIIPHVDDFGRMPGSPAKVKALVVPMLPKSIKEVEASIRQLHDHGLIIWYETNGDKYLQVTNFESHQSGLHKRTPSKFPAPFGKEQVDERTPNVQNTVALSASEYDIEEMLVHQIESNELIEGEEVVTTERQMRVGNSYFDIFVTAKSGRKYLFEVKRQRLSNASIEQILKYRDMVDGEVVCILIGNGVSSNFDLAKCKAEKVNVMVYNDSLAVDSVLLIDVICRQITLNNNGIRLNHGDERYLASITNRTELNRTEEKGREKEQKGNEKSPADDFDFNTNPDDPFLFYQNNFDFRMSPYIIQDIKDWCDSIGDELVTEAMKRALSQNKRAWSYVSAILKDWQSSNVKTIEQAQAEQAEHERRKLEKGGQAFAGSRQNAGGNQGKGGTSPFDGFTVPTKKRDIDPTRPDNLF